MKLPHLVFLACGIAGGILGTEALLRTLDYPYIGCKKVNETVEHTIGKYDPVTGWGYRPHSTTRYGSIVYTFSRGGYRSLGTDDRPDAKKPRILIVGDSSLFGHELNFTDTVGYKLGLRLDGAYEILNFAVQGFGLDQAYLRLQEVMDRYKPTYVIFDLIEDQDNRHVNRDRRILAPCLRLRGTKPVFTLRNSELFLMHRAEPFHQFDTPRLRLIWRRAVEYRNRGKSDKYWLSESIYIHLIRYIKDHGAVPVVVNYLSEVRPYQTGEYGRGVIIDVEPYDPQRVQPDGWHPNALGTTRMADALRDKIRTTGPELK
jgi:hypothetical protein